jgi:hypothetical protein
MPPSDDLVFNAVQASGVFFFGTEGHSLAKTAKYPCQIIKQSMLHRREPIVIRIIWVDGREQERGGGKPTTRSVSR